MNLIYPRAMAKIEGRAVPLVSCEVSVSRWSRADSASLVVPDEVAKDVAPFAKIELDLFYQHHPEKTGHFELYASESPIQDGRIECKDKWWELGTKRHTVTETFRDVTLTDVVQQLCARAGINVRIGSRIAEASAMGGLLEGALTPGGLQWFLGTSLGRRRSRYHVYKTSIRQAIEQACENWLVSPLIFLGPDGTLYFGAERDPSAMVQRFIKRKNIIDRRIQREERQVDQALVQATGDLYSQWLDEQQKTARIPHWSMQVIYCPWIWHGDLVEIEHPDLTGRYRVATATHRAHDFSTTLDLEAA